MSVPSNLPLSIYINDDVGLKQYIQEIKQFKPLPAEEEYMLAKRYQEHKDIRAAESLITSQLNLVVKVAYNFRGYGLPMGDLISEGNIGLMKAVKRFDPELGNRLSTYALWWIRAAIQEYVLNSWSLVRIGTTAAQKKLFYNLAKLKRRILNANQKSLSEAEIKQISEELGVRERDVSEMEGRLLGSDISLNKVVSYEDEREMGDLIADPKSNHEVATLESLDMRKKRQILADAMKNLSDKERYILEARKLRLEPLTLDQISKELKVSVQYIHEVENRAVKKITKFVQEKMAPTPTQ